MAMWAESEFKTVWASGSEKAGLSGAAVLPFIAAFHPLEAVKRPTAQPF
jgi:hypothetical protein